MLKLGKNSKFEGEVLGNAFIELGDNTYVAKGTRIVGNGLVKFGDYCKIHDNCMINSAEGEIIFGHNCWFGERTILDGTGGIHGGNNIGVGIASQLYSHIAHGDVMEGCRFKSSKQLVIEDDVWFVGQCLVSPITARQKSMAMLGSVIVKNMDENTIYGGSPADDLTLKLGKPWRHRADDEKLFMMQNYINEYRALYDNQFETYWLCACKQYPPELDPNTTYFNVSDRTYTKLSTEHEQHFMRWLTSYKARFVPLTNS